MPHLTPTEFLTGILVVTTAIYAWITFKIMKANKQIVGAMHEQREAEVRPYVTINVFTVPRNPIFYLRIANTGKTGANNVRLTLDRDFYPYGQTNAPSLKAITAFQQPIQQLPPGAEMVFGLAQGFVVLGNNVDEAVTPPVFSISATYSFGERTVSETTTIDLRPYKESKNEPSPAIDELEKIREALEKIANK
jgi:hypothetical protein